MKNSPRHQDFLIQLNHMGKTIKIEIKRYRQLIRNEERILKIRSYTRSITRILERYDKGSKKQKPA